MLPPYNFTWQNDNGDEYNEANPDSLSPSMYNLEVSDANGCSQFLTSLMISEPDKVQLDTFSSDFTQPSCFNSQDGSININGSGGVPTYSYQLEHLNSGTLYFSNSINTLGSGDYNLIINDANGCEFDTSFTFDNPADLIFSSSITNLSCFGSNDGLIVYDYIEFNALYTTYFNGQQVLMDSVPNLAAGIYTSILEDANGCQKILVDTISQPNLITYTSNVFVPSCSEENLLQNSLISNGQILLDISGGSGYYNVVSSSDTNQIEEGFSLSINNLSSGNYDFEIVDSEGCSITFNETVGSPTPINAYANITDIVVYGNSTGAIDVSITGGEFPYQTSWSSPNFVANSEDISNLNAGLYTLTVVDDKGLL